jgi:hypothetical protein
MQTMKPFVSSLGFRVAWVVLVLVYYFIQAKYIWASFLNKVEWKIN